jgi:hypothetical protein
MPIITGNSSGQYQPIGAFLVLTAARVELRFADNANLEPKNLGFYYMVVVGNTAPFPAAIVARGIVNTPGVYVEFSNVYGFTLVRYSFFVRWKVQGKAWTYTYS